MNEQDLKPGTQVVYVPSHAFEANGKPNLNHPDVEEGFIVKTSPNRYNALCGFYNRGNGYQELRTKANGEWCSTSNLVIRPHRFPWTVEADLERILNAYREQEAKP